MTIELRNVTKSYRTTHGSSSILKSVSLKIEPGEHVGILGQNGSGKSTLIRILGGSERPTTGEVRHNMSVSWPLAFGGAFLGALTGADNARFVCRLYGVDPDEQMPFIEDFTELGKYLREPLKTYSSGMRARLAFGVSMAINFDCYLIDEIVAVGDDRFQRKCQFELFEKRRDRAMLIVSHSADFVRDHCQRASVLSSGVLNNFPSIDEAYAFYSSHELAIQPHMVAAAKRAQLLPDTIELISEKYTEVGPGTEFDARLESIQLHRVPVFDSCDVVGRLARSGHRDAAMHVARFLTDRVPDETLFWVTLGDLLSADRKHVTAVEAYGTALKLTPDSYWAHRNLATEYFNVGRYEDAIPHFEKARELGPQDAANTELLLRLVDCYFLLDRSPEIELLGPPSAQKCHVLDIYCGAVTDGGAARIAIGGLSSPSNGADGLRCKFSAGGQQIEGKVSFARNSIRRLASLTSQDAFSFVCYSRLPVGTSHVEIEIWDGESKIYEASHPVHYFNRTHGIPGDDAIDAARRSNALHDADLSLIYYGLSDWNGSGVDIVEFAESLIARGLYDEAEYRLRTWITHDRSKAEDVGFALDLLCAEIARARLPGWRSQIEEFLNTELPNEASGSVEANRGHASVANGELEAAIAHYAEASSQSADHVIHFAKGIHTAKFAFEVPKPNPNIQLDTVAPDAGLVHFFACDGEYFVRYAKKLVKSSYAAGRGVALQIHAHIVDANDEARALAQTLQASHGLNVTFETSPSHLGDANVRRAYYTCARFLQAPALLRQYNRSVVITETDCLINWDWSDLIRHAGKADIGYLQAALWNWVPWTKVPAGIVMLAPSQRGLALGDYIARFIEHVFRTAGASGLDLWTVDQVALWLAHEHAPDGTRRAHLPMSSILTLATGDKLNI